MLNCHTLLTRTLNQIHCWNEPEYNPMTRMFATRISGTVCTVIEVACIVFSLIKIGEMSAKHLIFSLSFPMRNMSSPGFLADMKAGLLETGQLIVGLAGTIFLGIVFSPEANFKLHVKLGLTIDNLAEKAQRTLSAKLQKEWQKAEVMQARNEIFAKLEEQLQSVNEVKTEASTINSQLAELLQFKPN